MCKLVHNRATLRAPLFQTQAASTKSTCSQNLVHGLSALSSKENSKQSRHHLPATSLASPDFSSSLNEDDTAQDLSLRAILSMCLPERPPVTVGALLRESIFGEVHLGSYHVSDVCASNSTAVQASSPALVSRPVVIKEFNLSQVLKKQSKRGGRLYEDALIELQIHANVSQQNVPNVIQLYAMHIDVKSSKLFAYMEYAAQGELFSLLHNRSASSPLPVSVAANFFVQILQGVRDLHAMNVVHRDLSLENVLLTADNTVKICDFGLAAICPPGTTISDRKVIGKVKYMCPELFYGEEYDPRLVDVWSAGVIFFIMLTSVFPYYAPSVENQGLVMLCNERINDMLMHWKMMPLEEEIVNVFAKIFCPPNKRWQVHQLLQLPFCQRFAQLPKEVVDQALKADVQATVVQTTAPVPIFRAQSLCGSPALIRDAYNVDYELASSSPLSSCSSTATTRSSSVLTESSRTISECSQEVELINSLSSSRSITPSSNSVMSPSLSSSKNAICLVHMRSNSSTHNDDQSSGSSDQMEKEPWSPSAFHRVQKHAYAQQCLVDSAAVLSRHYSLAESPLPTPRRLNLDFSLAF